MSNRSKTEGNDTTDDIEESNTKNSGGSEYQTVPKYIEDVSTAQQTSEKFNVQEASNPIANSINKTYSSGINGNNSNSPPLTNGSVEINDNNNGNVLTGNPTGTTVTKLNEIKVESSTLNEIKSQDTSSKLANEEQVIQHSICSIGSLVCRICQTNELPERLISPCLCKGTLAYVHKYCLEHWLSTSGVISCELCNYTFHTEQTLRYTFLQSLQIWYRHPNNRGLLQADFLVCSLLSVVSFGLVGICMLGLHYFILQGKRLGISRLWTQGSVTVFLIIVIFVYCVNVLLIIKSQLVPWYRWWRSARIVKLVLHDRRALRKQKLRKSQFGTDEIELQSTVLSGQQQNQHLNQPQPARIPTPVINDRPTTITIN